MACPILYAWQIKPNLLFIDILDVAAGPDGMETRDTRKRMRSDCASQKQITSFIRLTEHADAEREEWTHIAQSARRFVYMLSALGWLPVY